MASPKAPAPLHPSENLADTFNIVYFDLETTSLAWNTEITQIAAIFQDRTFNQYVLPTSEITEEASRITGLRVEEGNLFLHGERVETLSINEALQSFIDWLHDIEKCVLVAHNGKNFDAPRIMYHVALCGLTDNFLANVLGFSDTLPMFQQRYPGLINHKQTTLAKELLNETYDAHSASADVEMLRELVQYAGFTDRDFRPHWFSATWLSHALPSVNSFDELVQSKIIYQSVAEKLGYSGFQLNDLQQAHQAGGFEGLKDLLKDCTSDAVIYRLHKYFSSK